MAEAEMGKVAAAEGADLLAPPTVTELSNGRFRCAETGHEMVAGDVECYSQSKRCRLGLIDFALSHSQPPFNMFKQDPLCRSKLICKLTGDRVNKSEPHIWKHINGRRFLQKLEQKEVGDAMSTRKLGVVNKEQKAKKTVDEIVSEMRDPSKKHSCLGRDDHSVPGAESDLESDESDGPGIVHREDHSKESEDICMRIKRMTIEIGPSSFASRKKKPRKDTPY